MRIARVCSAHFEERDYKPTFNDTPRNRDILFDHAIPFGNSIFNDNAETCATDSTSHILIKRLRLSGTNLPGTTDLPEQIVEIDIEKEIRSEKLPM